MAAAPSKLVMSGKPLTGLQSVGSGSRIVTWDHFASAIVFAGKITRIDVTYKTPEQLRRERVLSREYSQSKI